MRRRLLSACQGKIRQCLSDGLFTTTESPVARDLNPYKGVRWTRTCTKKLPVELLQDVDGLGSSGEVAHVSSGYARNYLVPGRLARPIVGAGSTLITATRKEGNASAPIITDDAVAEKKRRKKLEGIVRKLTETVILFKRDVASDGVLQESVRRIDIVEAVGKQLGIEIVEGLLDMEDEDVLTTIGDFVIPLKLVVGAGEYGVAKLQIRVLQKNTAAS